MCPHHFERLAVLRAMELGVSNLHVNSFFHVIGDCTVIISRGLIKFFGMIFLLNIKLHMISIFVAKY